MLRHDNPIREPHWRDALADIATGEPERMVDGLFALFTFNLDPDWVEGIYTQYAQHDDERVHRAANLCLGLLARLHDAPPVPPEAAPRERAWRASIGKMY